jgi:hypothetical protein
MGNELNRSFSKEEIQIAKNKTKHEKMLTIPGHKENANQNHTKILPHFCSKEHKQQQILVRMWREKEP